MSNPKERLLSLLQGGAKKSDYLLQKLNISQPSFSRLVAGLGNDVISIGKARATVYASARNFRGLGSTFPLFRISPQGNVNPCGHLTALAAGQFTIETEQYKNGRLFDGLPYFLQDMRPQGFMGRSFTHKNDDLRLPERIADWSEDDALYALLLRGEECSGDLIVGDESLQRHYQAIANPALPLFSGDRDQGYVALANEAMAGTAAGSSAGGEQPKFTTAILPTHRGPATHVIVKFSPANDAPASTRWRDLLIAEHLALMAISKSGYSAAKSAIVLAGNRAFLEVTRFDRHGDHGRSGLISLGALDDEHFGKRDTWLNAANRLLGEKLISHDDANALRFQAVFGQLIGNTDQHFGNASLMIEDNQATRYRLAPAYDVLPMLYAPVNGEIVERRLSPPMPNSETMSVWLEAYQCATAYWQALTLESRLSEDFRKIAIENVRVLDALAPIAQGLAGEGEGEAVGPAL